MLNVSCQLMRSRVAQEMNAGRVKDYTDWVY